LYGNTINKNLDLITESIVLQEVNNPYTNPIDGFRFKLDYAIEIGAGKLEILPKVFPRNLQDVAALYTPGVGYLVKEILERDEALGEITGRNKNVTACAMNVPVPIFRARHFTLDICC
jgi:malic enzyme